MVVEEDSGELGSLLQELASAGQFDSSGAFQLDLTRSIRKLTEFRHKSSDRFLLHLVSAAVAFGSRHFSVRFDSHSWLVQFDVATLGFEEMKQIFSGVGGQELHRRGVAQRELGLALCCLHGVGDCHIQVRSTKACLELTPAYLSVSPNGFPQSQGLAVEVGIPGWTQARSRRMLHAMCEKLSVPPVDILAFERESRYAPLFRHVNGKAVTPWSEEGRSRGTLRLQGDLLLPRSNQLLVERSHESEHTVSISLISGKPGISLHIVNFGLFFQDELAAPAGFRAVIAHNGLKRDLLGRNLIRDEAYRQMLAEIVALAAELLQACLTRTQDSLHAEVVKALLAPGQTWDEAWMNLRVLRLAGWPRDYSLAEVATTYARQGFLHYDASLPASPHSEALLVRFSPAFTQQPYRELEILDDPDKWMLRVPMNGGEIRYSAAWPGPEAHIDLLLARAQMTLPNVPRGVVWLLDESACSESALQEVNVQGPLAVLANFFRHDLRSRPYRYTQSAPALRLALWLLRGADGAALSTGVGAEFQLPIAGGGSLPLSRLLSSNTPQPYLLADSPPIVSLEIIWLLTAAQLEALQNPPREGILIPPLVPYEESRGGALEAGGEHALMSLLLAQSMELFSPARAGIFDFSSYTWVQANGCQDFDFKIYEDVTGKCSLWDHVQLLAVRRKVWFSIYVRKQGAGFSRIRSYLAAPGRDAAGKPLLLFMERPLEKGLYTEADVTKLSELVAGAPVWG